MSRTYRKSKYPASSMWYDHSSIDPFYYFIREEKESSKATKAIHRVKGDSKQVKTKYYMNQISKVRRTNDRNQLSQIDVNEDVCQFDDSAHIKKRKGIWWEIY